ncbi:MAG: hypothetical protein HKO56_06610 [Bacteroidia bacterium]|nr:hypothetical protein [Bacteroidia bacterium]NNC84954.1 hypothetical protein [Bacteroidia bacterium]NNM16311.1 hypothetical protein [Bacteroidia bacterium]
MNFKNYTAGLTIFLFFLSTTVNYAQSIGGISFNYNQALKDYKHNINSSPMGISFIGLYAIPESKFSIGGELGVSMFANEEYTKDLTEEGYAGAMVEVYEEDCYISYYAVTRYTIPSNTMLSPYLEGKLGGISFFNDKVYEKPTGPNAPKKIKDKTEFLGTSFQYGMGGGFMLQLDYIFPSLTDQIHLDFGFTLLNGTETDYRSVNYTEEIVRSNNDVEYTSRTNNIAYKFGVVFVL